MTDQALATLYKDAEIYVMDKDEPQVRANLPTSFVLDGVSYGLLNTDGEYYINGDPANRIPGHKAQALYSEKMARVQELFKDNHIFLLDSKEWEVTAINEIANKEF